MQCTCACHTLQVNDATWWQAFIVIMVVVIVAVAAVVVVVVVACLVQGGANTGGVTVTTMRYLPLMSIIDPCRWPGSPKLQAIYNITGNDPATLADWAADPQRARAKLIV